MDSTQSSFKFRHVGSFTLLLLLSVFQPKSIWPEFPVPFVPVILVILGLILIYKVQLTIGVKGVWQKYRVELGLFGAYEVVCLMSLFLNRDLYPTTADFIRWGLTFPIFQLSIPLAALLFVLPQNSRGLSLTNKLKKSALPTATPLAVLIILFCGMAFWQMVDYTSAWEIFRFSIAGDSLLSVKEPKQFLLDSSSQGNIRSFFAVSTDLGGIASVVSVSLFCIVSLFFKQDKNRAFNYSALLAFIAVLGMFSGARVFLLGTGVGVIALAITIFKDRKGIAITVILLALMITHIALLYTPWHYTRKLAEFFPYLYYLNAGIAVQVTDFIPSISIESFGNRIPIWTRALSVIQENMLFGLSNGGFRLLIDGDGREAVQNAHNIYLQVFLDSGVIGALFIMGLTIRILRTAKSSARVVLLAVAATSFVDNFSDHTLSWIVITCYLLAHLWQKSLPFLTSNKQANHKKTKNIIFTFFLLTLFTWLGLARHKQQSYLSKPIEERLLAVHAELFSGYSKSIPLFMHETLRQELLKDKSPVQKLAVTANPAPQNWCPYRYPGGWYVARKNVDNPLQRSLGTFREKEVYYGQLDDIENCSSASLDPLQMKHWVSSHGLWTDLFVKPQERDEIELRPQGYVGFRSPVFVVNTEHNEIAMRLENLDSPKTPAIINVFIIDASDNQILKKRELSVETVSEVMVRLNDHQGKSIFIQLRMPIRNETKFSGAARLKSLKSRTAE